jgi:nonribosomal peptide synthetase DhbF
MWAISLPGHEPGDDRAMVSVEEAASICFDALMSHVRGPVAIYGHCAGAAVCFELTKYMESIGHAPVAVFIGAALPDPPAEETIKIAKTATDEMLHAYLRSLGGFLKQTGPEEIPQILRAVRHDLIESANYYNHQATARSLSKLRTPLYCLFGTHDKAANGSEREWKQWERLADLVTPFQLAGGDHYFVEKIPKEVSRILSDVLGVV